MRLMHQIFSKQKKKNEDSRKLAYNIYGNGVFEDKPKHKLICMNSYNSFSWFAASTAGCNTGINSCGTKELQPWNSVLSFMSNSWKAQVSVCLRSRTEGGEGLRLCLRNNIY